jgi:cellulose synthase operon protein C
MSGRKGTALLVTAWLAACASGGAGGALRVRQADYKRPDLKSFESEAEISAVKDAYQHAGLADIARVSGNLDQARAEDHAAAEGYSRYADTFPSSEWRLVFRKMASERYLQAREPLSAAAEAKKILDDPLAGDGSRAVAARLSAAAWQQEAVAQTRAGTIEPLHLVEAAQRKGEPRPRVPPEPWKRFVEASDLYGTLYPADPILKASPEERRAAGGVDPAELALLAAQVEFASDNMEDARSRFERIIATWPSNAQVMESAVPYDLETFLVMKDDEGFEVAARRLRAVVRAEADKSAVAGKAPGAGEEQRKAAETFARLEDALAKREQGVGYTAGTKLLNAGNTAEAAATFEKFADEFRGNPDAPNALFNAAIARDRNREPRKAMALRERILKEYPDAKVAPQTALALASARSAEKDRAGAVKLYEQYLEKWPKGGQRCLALYNLGVETEGLGRKLEAAQRYKDFASDTACLEEDPDSSARALFHAADLFAKAKKKAEATELWKVLSSLTGVKDPAAKSQVEQAKRLLKRAP